MTNKLIKLADELIDTNLLITKQALIDHLTENGANDRELSQIRDENYRKFGNELMWRYPISDGKHLGTMIIPVQEGILCLPYNEVIGNDTQSDEFFVLEDVFFFDADSMSIFINDWKSFSKDLLSSMNEMLNILSTQSIER